MNNFSGNHLLVAMCNLRCIIEIKTDINVLKSFIFLLIFNFFSPHFYAEYNDKIITGSNSAEWTWFYRLLPSVLECIICRKGVILRYIVQTVFIHLPCYKLALSLIFHFWTVFTVLQPNTLRENILKTTWIVNDVLKNKHSSNGEPLCANNSDKKAIFYTIKERMSCSYSLFIFFSQIMKI